MYPHCKLSEEEIFNILESVTPEDVKESLTKESIQFNDYLNFISPVASRFLPEMATKAQQVKNKHFGKTIRLYSPLYISNYCINDCQYCGFRSSYHAERRRLTEDEIINEAKIIRSYGIDNLLLVSGEDPNAVSVDFLVELVKKLRTIFSTIAIEIYPMSESDYKRLFDAGVVGVTLYQETYNKELYEELHPRGPKSSYEDRLEFLNNAGRAGFYNLGLGALLGLDDWHIESVSMVAHAFWLRKKFWKTKVNFSFPRLTPVACGFNPIKPVSEEDLEQMMLAIRLLFPTADIFISTRESGEFRNKVAHSCASYMSAASQVVPGGYTEAENKDLGQFTVNAQASVKEVAAELQKEGLEVIFKDWDNCITI